jgi:hypothetical protein
MQKSLKQNIYPKTGNSIIDAIRPEVQVSATHRKNKGKHRGLVRLSDHPLVSNVINIKKISKLGNINNYPFC